MLVLTRKKNESVIIDGDISITVVEIRGDKVRLGIVCPKDVPVHRQEVYDAIHGGAVDIPLIAYRPGEESRRANEPTQFIEISLGQLLAQVGAEESEVTLKGPFTNEGGISAQ
jgi:carbon storage regulator